VGAATELTKAPVRQLLQLNSDVDLFTQQDEYSSEYGKYRYNRSQTIEIYSRDKSYKTRDYEPDAQQQHPYVFREVHGNIPFDMCSWLLQ